jgi:hypothetical protein
MDRHNFPFILMTMAGVIAVVSGLLANNPLLVYYGVGLLSSTIAFATYPFEIYPNQIMKERNHGNQRNKVWC